MIRINDSWFYQQFNPVSLGDIRKEVRSIIVSNNKPPQFVSNSDEIRRREGIIRSLGERFPEEFIHRLLYSMSRYLEFTDLLVPEADYAILCCCHFEWLLYADVLEKRYRDHVTHALRVACLGNWMLDQEWENLRPPLKSPLISEITEIVKKSPYLDYLMWAYYKKRPGDVVNDSTIRAAWWLVGLFHDIGYPFGSFVREDGAIDQSYSFYSGNVCDGIKHRIQRQDRSLLFTHLREQMGGDGAKAMDFLTSRAALEGKRHGIAAALSLLLWLEEIESRSYIDLKRRLAFELAALAIAQHDLVYMFPRDDALKEEEPNKYFNDYKVRFREEPLSFLLVLADEIQEWGRPRLVPETVSNWGIGFQYYIECTDVKLEQRGKELWIDYVLASDAIKKKTEWSDKIFFDGKADKLGQDFLDPKPLFNDIVIQRPRGLG